MEVKAGQTMSAHPMTVRYKDDLMSAFIRMRREGYRHMPVIDDSENVVGIISDRDFQRAMWPVNSPDAHGLPESPHFRKDAKVCEYMSWPIKSFPEETNLVAVIETMIASKISSVVITRGDQMTGIVTHEDLLRMLASLLKEPATVKDRVLQLAYNTPMSKVTEMLAAAGV